jgi:UPF0755 protein
MKSIGFICIKFRDKMIKEYRNFWNKNVWQKEKQGLTNRSYNLLASIVHKESVKDERPKNSWGLFKSIEIRMPLQADPVILQSKEG